MNPEITLTNYEEYLILRTDGELSAAEEAALERFLAQHPELHAEAAAYAATRVAPDETGVFTGKAALLQPEPAAPKVGRRIALGSWSLAASAVAAALLVWVGIRYVNQPEIPVRPIAGRATPAPASPHPEPPVTPQPEVTAPSDNRIASKARAVSGPGQKADQTTAAPSQPEPALPQPELIAALDVAPMQPVIISEPAVLPPSELAVDLPVVAPVQRNSVLPINSERLQGLASLGTTARNNLQRAKALRESLRNTEATVAFAGRELFTVRF